MHNDSLRSFLSLWILEPLGKIQESREHDFRIPRDRLGLY